MQQSVSPHITDRKQKRGYQGGEGWLRRQSENRSYQPGNMVHICDLVLGRLETGPSLGSLPARLDKNRESLSQIVTIINNK